MENMKFLLFILQWFKYLGDSIYKDVIFMYFDYFRVYWQELFDVYMEMGLNIEEVLMYFFQRLDFDISLEIQVFLEDEMIRNFLFQVVFFGVIVCMVYVDGVYLYVVNVGDCRVIFGVQEDNGMWFCFFFIRDYNVWNQVELLRLKKEYFALEDKIVIMDDRLLGIFMFCRVFGDVQLKWSKEL